MRYPPNMVPPPDHDERLAVARWVAQWELGDASWADLILSAYLRPQAASKRLDEEMAE